MNRNTYNERDERYEDRWRTGEEGRRLAGNPNYATQSGWQREREYGQQPERYSDWRGPAPRREESPRDYDEWRNATREDPNYSRDAQQQWGAERGYGRSTRTDMPQDTSDYEWPRRNEQGRWGDMRAQGASRDSSWQRGNDRWQGGQREDLSRWESEGGSTYAPRQNRESYERGPYGNGYGRSFGGDSFGSGAFGSAYGSSSSARGDSYGGYREGGQGGYGSYGNYGSSGRYENDARRSMGGGYGSMGGSYEGQQGAWRSQSGSGMSSQRGWEGESYAGRGPKGFQRSDERIRESVSERLEQSDDVDASEIEVAVKGGDVTLTGSVPSRWMKRCAEDCVESLPGVKDVTNQLRVQARQGKAQGASSSSEQGERGSSGYATSGSSSTSGYGNSGSTSSTESKSGTAKTSRSN